MKVLLMTGDSPRHLYLASCLEAAGLLVGLVIEKREPRLPPVPVHCDEQLRALFLRHFRERDEVEFAFFGNAFSKPPKVQRLDLSREELNSSKNTDFVNKVKPDLVISYGVHKLENATLAAIPCLKWNTHGGLSPWYRGVITHFWPTYMLEPQMTGMTLHELTPQIDAGPIIHQTLAPMVRGDGVHHTACRAVELYGRELPKVLELLEAGRVKAPDAQKTSGKLWLQSDWRPEHLRTVYSEFNNRVVDLYLDGKLGIRNPHLVRQFS